MWHVDLTHVNMLRSGHNVNIQLETCFLSFWSISPMFYLGFHQPLRKISGSLAVWCAYFFTREQLTLAVCHMVPIRLVVYSLSEVICWKICLLLIEIKLLRGVRLNHIQEMKQRTMSLKRLKTEFSLILVFPSAPFIHPNLSPPDHPPQSSPLALPRIPSSLIIEYSLLQRA